MREVNTFHGVCEHCAVQCHTVGDCYCHHHHHHLIEDQDWPCGARYWHIQIEMKAKHQMNTGVMSVA